MQCVHMTTHTLSTWAQTCKRRRKRYTSQTQTLKPVLMAHSAASSTELIAAGHDVVVPHVSGEDCTGGCDSRPQALCGIQYDKSHGSLTERDAGHWKQERT